MADSMSFGISEVDKLIGGGIRPGSYLIEAEPGTGELAFVAAFLNEGLRQENFCAVIVYDVPHEELIDRLTGFGVDARAALDSGQFAIADLWSEGEYDPERRGPILKTHNVSDPNSVLRLYTDLAQVSEEKLKTERFRGARVAVCSLSSEIMNFKFEPAYKFVKVALNMVRQRKYMSLNLISPKMFDETIVAAFEHLYDGILVLTMKNVNGRFHKFIRVKRSPLPGSYTDETPYEIVGGKPCLATSFAEPLPTFRSHLKFNVDGTISLLGLRFHLIDATSVSNLLKQFADKLGYETVAEEIYKYFKGHGQTIFKEFLCSMNIDMSAMDPKELLEFFADYLTVWGVGTTKVVKFSDNLISIRITNSLCSETKNSSKPMSPYLAGVFAGVVESLLNSPTECIEIKCMAKGDDYCEFLCQARSLDTS